MCHVMFRKEQGLSLIPSRLKKKKIREAMASQYLTLVVKCKYQRAETKLEMNQMHGRIKRYPERQGPCSIYLQ